MDKNQNSQNPPGRKNPLFKFFSGFDGLIKKFIPNFNARAVLYITFIFAVAVYLRIWSVSPSSPKPGPNPSQNQETVIANDAYWQSKTYKDKLQNQTVQSFTQELQNWLDGKSQEFVKRKFEDMFYINAALTPLTGGDLATVVPQDFNYLENIGKARYQYAKQNGFLADQPQLVPLGNVVCDINDKTEKATGIELYDFRYASMPKLAQFMNSKPDWKITVGDLVLDISDPRIEDKDLLKNLNVQTQPAGLFSFLIFHDPKNNRIFLADSHILEDNQVDSRLMLGRITSGLDKSPKVYFKYGYGGCSQINSVPQINYGQSN